MSTIWINLLQLVENMIVAEEPQIQALVLSELNKLVAFLTGQPVPPPIATAAVVAAKKA
jgi:hypothetical protein